MVWVLFVMDDGWVDWIPFGWAFGTDSHAAWEGSNAFTSAKDLLPMYDMPVYDTIVYSEVNERL